MLRAIRTSMSNLSSIGRADRKQMLESNTTNGVLLVPKEYGMFACKNFV